MEDEYWLMLGEWLGRNAFYSKSTAGDKKTANLGAFLLDPSFLNSKQMQPELYNTRAGRDYQVYGGRSWGAEENRFSNRSPETKKPYTLETQIIGHRSIADNAIVKNYEIGAS